MEELLYRVFKRPRVALLLFITSFFISIFAIATPIFIILLINKYVSSGLNGTLYTLTIGILIVLVIEALMKKLRSEVSSKVSPIEDAELSKKVFHAIVNAKKLSYDQLSSSLKQELLTRLLESIKSAYSSKNINTFFDIPFAILFLIVIYILSPMISLIVALIIILISVFIYFGINKGSNDKTILVSALSAKTNIVISALNSADMIRVQNAQKYISNLWQKQIEGIEKLKLSIEKKHTNIMNISQFLTALVGIMVYFVGTQEVVAGELNIGSLIGLSILSSKAVAPFMQAITISEQINSATLAKQQIDNFLRIPQEAITGTALKSYKGELEFSNVSFTYPNTKSPVFENINFKLKESQILAVYGPNGSGKSTFAKLLAGIYEPTKGSVLIDGVELSQIAPYWYRENINYMPQEPSFVPGTILDNIKLGDDKLEDSKLNEIISDANLKEFLDKSTKGLLTQILENGKNLSLGIRHRIALASSLKNDAKLVIFDEPTETLDMDGKNAIYSLVNKLKKSKKTIVLFTHDRYLLSMADFYMDLSMSNNAQFISKEQYMMAYQKQQEFKKRTDESK
ncbi:peptidase domain-containing ABC transporter [Sulfurimonas sp.]